MEAFRMKMMAESVNENDFESSYAENIFVLEKELGGSAATNENSLLLKFYNQVEHLNKFFEEQEKHSKKMR